LPIQPCKTNPNGFQLGDLGQLVAFPAMIAREGNENAPPLALALAISNFFYAEQTFFIRRRNNTS
jgi:hypothetical protein